ncbi:hypothetical protein F4810DRAFT_325562 [Camillea tinctor]|nr:hypothetical protein F4810DRAFT_325562 [Camillea tinctor]
MALSTDQDRRPTVFLDLPREIRDIIYEFALVQPSRVTKRHDALCERSQRSSDRPEIPPFVRRGISWHWSGWRHLSCTCDCAKRQLGLLQVNRRLHAETAPIFWSRNIHTFESVDMFVRDMRRLRPEYRALVRHVSIIHVDFGRGLQSDDAPGAHSMLWHTVMGCKSLRTLEVPPSVVKWHAAEVQRLKTELPHFESLKIVTMKFFAWPHSDPSYYDLVYAACPREVPLQDLQRDEARKLVDDYQTNTLFHIDSAVYQQLTSRSHCGSGNPPSIKMELSDVNNSKALVLRDGTKLELEFLGLPNSKETCARLEHERQKAESLGIPIRTPKAANQVTTGSITVVTIPKREEDLSGSGVVEITKTMKNETMIRQIVRPLA